MSASDVERPGMDGPEEERPDMHPAYSPQGGSLTRPLLSLLAAVLFAAAVVALARLAVGTASGQRMDQLILSGARDHQGMLSQYAKLAVGSVSTPVVGTLLAVAVVLVLVRRRASLLVPLAALVVGANLTTQVIKHLVVTREALGPGIEVTPNSFPSGHTTLAATAMIALVLASGRARVLLAPLGALWTAAAGIGTLAVGWHRPSDVIGAIAVAAAWTFLVLSVHSLLSRRRRADGSRPAVSPAERAVALLLGLLGIGGLAFGALALSSLQLPLDLEDPSQQLPAFRATAALIGGGTAGWMALVLILRTPTSHRTRISERVP